MHSWEQRKLSGYLSTSDLKNREGTFSKKDVLSVSGREGVVNQIDFQGRSFAGKSVRDYRIVKHFDIVYTKSPLKEAPFGIIKTNLGQAGIVSTLYAVYSPLKNIYPPIIQRYFESSSRLNNFLRPLVNKGAKNDMKVKNSEVLKGTVILPSISEQYRIDLFFKTLDDLIAACERKSELLKKRKRYYLQQIFSQRLRFKGFTQPWQERKLGACVRIRQESLNTNNSDTVKIDIELENLSEDSGVVTGDTTIRTSSTSVFRKNDVLFGRLRPYLHKWWLATENGVKSGEIWAFTSNELIPYFLYGIIQSRAFLTVAEQSSGTKMPRADWKHIREASIFYPDNSAEQKLIGDLLYISDGLLHKQRNQILLFQTMKQAYLQLLFI
ncbi:restriction endonuclease subunit S [Bifidobacterium sp. ESL0682]|uniref:restriction endonuclease subunit S n=1 Tax=Bifidobacterium sp. ESL0682 TaxID=2983212 RepID=UPI0023FA2538|nr:restriction endonuclease subunit S [Bifidobacterium sp. ESL0682]WEV42429.1 restriction endonuclease subunit S [Bifidobacterium sp. ESL0682]